MSNVFEEVIGSAWNHPQAKPVINGTAGRSRDEIVSFAAGEVTISRNAPEFFYLGDAGSSSFVGRMLAAAGAGAWTANYS